MLCPSAMARAKSAAQEINAGYSVGYRTAASTIYNLTTLLQKLANAQTIHLLGCLY
jgi:hypothetical protein